MNVSRINVRGLNSRSAAGLWGSLLATVLLVLGSGAAQAAPTDLECGNGELPVQDLANPPDQPDLKVTGTCTVTLGADRKYYFGNVNILAGGKLIFHEPDGPRKTQTNFWASSNIIENDGWMIADGGPDEQNPKLPFGIYGGRFISPAASAQLPDR